MTQSKFTKLNAALNAQLEALENEANVKSGKKRRRRVRKVNGGKPQFAYATNLDRATNAKLHERQRQAGGVH